MKKKLHISRGLSLPIDLVTQRTSILGKTRSGKSYTAGVVVEEVLKAHQQTVILDPKGDWWGLRSSADGKAAGLPITIMGGKHGDIPLEPGAGAMIADVVVNEGISVVLDLSLFESKADEIRFATAFLDRLYRKNTKPLLLVIDESDTFAPQRPEKNETVMLNRMETICRRGAGRGIGVILISQRSAAIHKGCLSQTELMIAHQTTAPQDKDAMEGWVVDHGDEERRREFMGRISKLKKGMAIVWSPSWLEIYMEIQVRAKETYDSSDAPKVGRRRRPPKVLAPVDLERLKKHMAETIEKAKNEDPKLLHAEIARLKAEIASAKRTMAAPKHAQAPAPKAVVQTRVETKTVEVPVLAPGEMKKVRSAIVHLERALHRMGPMLEAERNLRGCMETLGVRLANATGAADKLRKLPPVRPAPAPPPSVPAARRIKNPPVSMPAAVNGEKPLNAGERKMLDVLARFYPGFRTRAQLAQLAGYALSGGTFGNYFGRLRKDGYVDERRDGSLLITEKGLQTFGGAVPEGPKSPEELLAFWRERLIAGERKMLDVLVGAHPDPMTREELGQESGYESSGGTFGNYLGTLRRNDLAVVEGNTVKASGSLFTMEGAAR